MMKDDDWDDKDCDGNDVHDCDGDAHDDDALR
jgi:hypothetical protein